MVLTQPQAVLVEEIIVTTAALFRELVDLPKRKPTSIRLGAPDVSDMMPLFMGVPLLQQRELDVAGKSLKTPFGWINCSVNYLVTKSFAAKEGSATAAARDLGAAGHVLSKHPGPGGLSQRLVVFANFKNPLLISPVRELLGELDVELYDEQEREVLHQRIVHDARHVEGVTIIH